MLAGDLQIFFRRRELAAPGANGAARQPRRGQCGLRHDHGVETLQRLIALAETSECFGGADLRGAGARVRGADRLERCLRGVVPLQAEQGLAAVERIRRLRKRKRVRVEQFQQLAAAAECQLNFRHQFRVLW